MQDLRPEAVGSLIEFFGQDDMRFFLDLVKIFAVMGPWSCTWTPTSLNGLLDSNLFIVNVPQDSLCSNLIVHGVLWIVDGVRTASCHFQDNRLQKHFAFKGQLCVPVTGTVLGGSLFCHDVMFQMIAV